MVDEKEKYSLPNGSLNISDALQEQCKITEEEIQQILEEEWKLDEMWREIELLEMEKLLDEFVPHHEIRDYDDLWYYDWTQGQLSKRYPAHYYVD